MQQYVISINVDKELGSNNITNYGNIIVNVYNNDFTELNNKLMFFSTTTKEEFEYCRNSAHSNYYFTSQKNIHEHGDKYWSIKVTVTCQLAKTYEEITQQFYNDALGGNKPNSDRYNKFKDIYKIVDNKPIRIS